MNKYIWVSWEIQRRNRSISNALGAKLFEIDFKGAAWMRYPSSIYKTIRIILLHKPEILFSQNPSMILAAVSVLMGKMLNIEVILDTHNAGLYPKEGRYRVLNWIALKINLSASLVLVSNENLKKYIEINSGSAIALPDPLPKINYNNAYLHRLDNEKLNIVFVCSWAEDEPYEKVIKAADLLPNDVKIYITGNFGKIYSKDVIASLPSNISLTGYLSIDEYESLLCGCDAVMVLTNREDCLVCGGYEAVAVNKPLILSDTEALRSYFSRGAIYTKNSIQEIYKSIIELQKSIHYYQEGIKRLNTQLSEYEKRKLTSVIDLIRKEVK